MSQTITERDASKLTVDDLRHLANWCDNQHGSWWTDSRSTSTYRDGRDLTVIQLLACYHAAHDAGYPGMEEWASEDSKAAHAGWRKAVEGALRTDGEKEMLARLERAKEQVVERVRERDKEIAAELRTATVAPDHLAACLELAQRLEGEEVPA